MEIKVLAWDEVKIGELGLLAGEFEIEVDGDRQYLVILSDKSS